MNSIPAPTTTDLDIEDNVADADHQLIRAELAGTDAALATWARTWGRSAIAALRELHDRLSEFDPLEDDDA